MSYEAREHQSLIWPALTTAARLEAKTANEFLPVREIITPFRLASRGPSSLAPCELGGKSLGGMLLPPPPRRSSHACRSFCSSVCRVFALGLLLRVPTRPQTSFSSPPS